MKGSFSQLFDIHSKSQSKVTYFVFKDPDETFSLFWVYVFHVMNIKWTLENMFEKGSS